MSLKILGVGWGRTGTLSLKAALEVLGFGPCYHMTELLRKPEHISQWQMAMAGVEVDWGALLGGYGSAVDYPACRHWREIGRCFPGIKYILTVRDPEEWYDSIRSTIYSTKPGLFGRLKIMAQLPFSKRRRRLLDVFRYIEMSLWQTDFDGRFDDREYAIEKYREHVENIRYSINPAELLVYDVSSGWLPLCAFLAVDIPMGVPFPHLNRREQFSQLMREYL